MRNAKAESDYGEDRQRLIELEATIKICDMLRQSLKELRTKLEKK